MLTDQPSQRSSTSMQRSSKRAGPQTLNSEGVRKPLLVQSDAADCQEKASLLVAGSQPDCSTLSPRLITFDCAVGTFWLHGRLTGARHAVVPVLLSVPQCHRVRVPMHRPLRSHVQWRFVDLHRLMDCKVCQEKPKVNQQQRPRI